MQKSEIDELATMTTGKLTGVGDFIDNDEASIYPVFPYSTPSPLDDPLLLHTDTPLPFIRTCPAVVRSVPFGAMPYVST